LHLKKGNLQILSFIVDCKIKTKMGFQTYVQSQTIFETFYENADGEYQFEEDVL
jgi:hypothetical protein